MGEMTIGHKKIGQWDKWTKGKLVGGQLVERQLDNGQLLTEETPAAQ